MLLLIYHVSMLLVGYWTYRKYFINSPSTISTIVISASLGLLVSLPVTYLLSVALSQTSDPLLFSVLTFCLFTLTVMWIRKKDITHPHNIFVFEDNKLHFPNLITGIFLVFCFGFSWYIMTKTFKTSSDGTLLVARNAVFDFGHALSIIRSMSWGDNIPYTSPFVANTEHLYHFMFHFWCALLEKFGMPITVAVNISSTVGFFLFLLTVFSLGKYFFSTTRAGIVSVLFIIFHGGLMFIPFFQHYGISIQSVLQNPNYFFTGPFDGSLYSIFFTLNVFVNQRHLGISLAFFFWLYWLFYREVSSNKLTSSRIVVYSLLIGLFTLWHLVLTIGLFISLEILLLLNKKWKKMWLAFSISFCTSFLFIHPWIPYLFRGAVSLLSRTPVATGNTGSSHNPFWFFSFVILNFGISLLFLCIGVARKRTVLKEFFPVLILIGCFMLISIPAGIIDQKYVNILLVICAFFSAGGIEILINKKNKFITYLVIVLLPVSMLSGMIDFMVIKNDYLFPVQITKNDSIVSFIRKNTPKDTIFLSYDDIFSPVTLAGRTEYLGFFKQPDIFLTEHDKYRKDRVANVFDVQDEESLRFAVEDTGVDYILLPPVEKKDFPYSINYNLMKRTFPVVVEDFNHILLRVK